MQEIYQDEVEEHAVTYRGMNADSLIYTIRSLKEDCETAGIRLEYSKRHALTLLAALNELARLGGIIEFPDDIIPWMSDYIRKRNKIHPETPKIVSIW